jgi:hypothetical protein
MLVGQIEDPGTIKKDVNNCTLLNNWYGPSNK